MPARTRPTTRLATARAFSRAVRSTARPGSAGLLTRLAALPRLARAVSRREYLGASTGQLASFLASAAYVVSPVDVIPEGLLGVFGLGDDALVLAYAASAFVNLTEDFLAWEQGEQARRDTSGAGTSDGSYHGPADGYRDTVEGHVIR